MNTQRGCKADSFVLDAGLVIFNSRPIRWPQLDGKYFLLSLGLYRL